MKLRHWFFLVGVLLFVAGIGFTIAGARAARLAPTVEAPITTPVATVKQIMKGIVTPAAMTVFNSVSTTVSIRGIEEKAPRTDEEWEEVGTSAAALIEAGNLLLMGTRAIDKDEWVKMSQAMMAAGKLTLKATQDKSADGVLAAGEQVNASCDACHRRYQRG